MDAKKALYRAKLKEAKQKQDKRIDSPLVRYNEHDQPICRVCDVVLKSESLWAAHQASRKHHEAITRYKANATGHVRSIPKSEPPTELVQKAQPSSTLPPNFFDSNDTKRQKAGLNAVDKIETETPKESIRSSDYVSSEKILGKRKGYPLTTEGTIASENLSDTTQTNNSGVGGALPEGFFDYKDVEATGKMGDSEVKHSRGFLPEGFFDKEDVHTNMKTSGSDVKQGKGSLPEGFFDNKDADLRARGIQPVKVDIKDEYKEFEKLIQEDLQEVDERYEEEEIDAADVREEEETLEQKAYRERVEMLKKKQLELKAARFGGKKSSTMVKDSSDEESSSDEEDQEENFAVDWRAKHL